MMIATLTALIAAAGSATIERSITVSGNADVRVAPDTVQLLLGVESWEKTTAKAKAANDERLNKTLATALRLGIDSKDIQTDHITIEPLFENSSYSRVRQPDGYTVRRSVAMTIRDIKRFEDILTGVLDSGTNRVDGIEFRTSALRKHRDSARSLAVKAAKEKAVAMAGDLGMKVGKPINVSESGGYGYWSGRYSNNAMSQNVVSQAGPAGESTEGFAPGQISVTATVSITFELEPL